MTWPYLTRGDIGGSLAAILILCLALAASVIGPQLKRSMNYGFGQDWNCSLPGKGGPVCIKQVIK